MRVLHSDFHVKIERNPLDISLLSYLCLFVPLRELTVHDSSSSMWMSPPYWGAKEWAMAPPNPSKELPSPCSKLGTDYRTYPEIFLKTMIFWSVQSHLTNLISRWTLPDLLCENEKSVIEAHIAKAALTDESTWGRKGGFFMQKAWTYLRAG